jgi:hypothetical protein
MRNSSNTRQPSTRRQSRKKPRSAHLARCIGLRPQRRCSRRWMK